MSSLLKSFSFLILTIVTSATVFSQDIHEGKNAATTQSRAVKDFTTVSINVPASVAVSQASDFLFEMEGRADILDQVVTEVKAKELVVKFRDSKWRMPSGSTLKITIHLPKAEGFEINGSGDLNVLTDLGTDKLSIQVNGSGDMNFKKVTANDLAIQINGSGSIKEMSGTATDASMQINGSGDISASNLACKSLAASVAGSGDISVGTTETISVTIAGSGNVFYKGNPSKVQKNIAGSGKVSQQ